MADISKQWTQSFGPDSVVICINFATMGRSPGFSKGGGRFFIEKGKAGSERSERCLRTFMRLMSPWWVWGEALEDIPFPCI